MPLPRTARPVCPFVTAGTIEDPGLFVGRKDELRRLAGWMSGSQPVSVNVVGGRLSGKSSLLQHFAQTYAQRVTEPGRFLVVCICLRLAKPKTEAEFYQTLAAALSKLRAVAQCKPLRTALAACSGGGKKEFSDLLELLSGRGLLPVFCVDEFEKLFDHKDTLGKDFYDGLHSLINSNKMMLIIATREPVEIVAEGQQLLSPFFNFGQACELKDFSGEEAEELLLLPDPAAPALDADERRLARKWGGCQPHLLQLAASFLFEAQRHGKSRSWAKQQFERERRRRLKVPQQRRFLSVPPWFRKAFVDFPRWLGRWPLRLGRFVDDTANFITGWLIILLVLAFVFKYAGIDDLIALLLKKID
uniref:nSTAND1 domain-containing NTPase n=1 Tax=Candidatus Electronema sp. TaxID=2698783 RepID=UPI0040576F5A